MLEDTQILRLIIAAAKLQGIIETCKIDREYLTLVNFHRSGTSNLKDVNAEFRGSKVAALRSRSDAYGDLCTSLEIGRAHV